MTANQLSYWNLQESKRHNTASEAETQRSNMRNEYLNLFRNVESQRHNLAAEKETKRTNIANEGINRVTAGAKVVDAGANAFDKILKNVSNIMQIAQILPLLI